MHQSTKVNLLVVPGKTSRYDDYFSTDDIDIRGSTYYTRTSTNLDGSFKRAVRTTIDLKKLLSRIDENVQEED